MVKDGCVYVSSLKINKPSDNSVAQLSDGKYIRILNFKVDIEQKIEVTMEHVITVSRQFLNNCSNIKKNSLH